uniref:GPI mannosyltransferase I n=1 Tax=Nelumbo nucifera TaxID=4432 RepID=A0A822Y863_NELNU|nr:TPA_asm: hypothetical protein HUJ06_028967 [Nelumbo nucifera]
MQAGNLGVWSLRQPLREIISLAREIGVHFKWVRRSANGMAILQLSKELLGRLCFGPVSIISMDFRSLLLFSAVLRVVLIIYGEWQDTHMEVRYTDVDYLVFSDAASLMASGKSPYERSTYRYSPLLAFLLIPNSFLHHSWGKFLFSASDLLVGLLIHTILKLRGVPENLCIYSLAVWLFNPFTITIGTRGNCEPIVCAMVLWIIICIMNGVICYRQRSGMGLLSISESTQSSIPFLFS